jgi:hypothetical protein
MERRRREEDWPRLVGILEQLQELFWAPRYQTGSQQPAPPTNLHKRAERELQEMEELKKVDLTSSFSLLTRNGRCCPLDPRAAAPPPSSRA